MTQRLNYVAAAGDGMKALNAVRLYIAGCGLPVPLVDLVYLRVSQINGCAYCIDAHTHDLLKGGVSVEKLALLPVWREAGALFAADEQGALAWAESVTRVSDNGVPQSDFDAAAGVFDARQLADLTIAIGLMNAYNRVAISFRTPPASARHASA